MKVWIVGVVLLFGVAELLDWMQQMVLPLPVLVAGGMILAIASNYRQLLPSPPQSDEALPNQSLPDQPQHKMTLTPSASSVMKSARSISFEVSKPFQPRD